MGNRLSEIEENHLCISSGFWIDYIRGVIMERKLHKDSRKLGSEPWSSGYEKQSCWEVVGSNPCTVYWMDMTFFHIDLLLKMYCLFEKTKNNHRSGRGWPTFLKKHFRNLLRAINSELIINWRFETTAVEFIDLPSGHISH